MDRALESVRAGRRVVAAEAGRQEPDVPAVRLRRQGHGRRARRRLVRPARAAARRRTRRRCRATAPMSRPATTPATPRAWPTPATAIALGLDGALEMDPGYQFRLEEGQKAIESSAAAQGHAADRRHRQGPRALRAGLRERRVPEPLCAAAWRGADALRAPARRAAEPLQPTVRPRAARAAVRGRAGRAEPGLRQRDRRALHAAGQRARGRDRGRGQRVAAGTRQRAPTPRRCITCRGSTGRSRAAYARGEEHTMPYFRGQAVGDD